jgi:hypothetical protein
VWEDYVTLQRQIAKLSGGYTFDGTLLKHNSSGASLLIEGCPHDDRMAAAFYAAGPHWRETPEMARIKEHKMVLYLVGEGGSRTSAEAFMKASSALIHSGGLGVKIESTGLAYSPVDWLRMAEGILTAHQAFVVYITGEETYSCGMHNLGLRDAIVRAAAAEDPVELLRIFTRYQFIENPNTRNGHTFSADETSPRYRLFEETASPFLNDSLFYNPYGMWRLKAV